MKMIHNKIPKVFKDFDSIKKNIIIVGGGRWARIILNEILENFPNINKIYIVTKNSEFLLNFSKTKKKKLFLKKSLNFKEISKINFAIVANKNRDHFLTTNKLLKKKIKILVEKPLVENINHFYQLKNNSNKNQIFVSSPFFFSYYFYYIKKNFLKEANYQVNIEWHDQINEVRNGIKKKHDFGINYLNDTIYHLFGILKCFFGRNNVQFIKKINHKNKGKIFLKISDNNIFLNCSRLKNNNRIRKISFQSKKNFYEINFSDDNNIILNSNGKNKKIKFNFCQKTLKYQLYFFFNHKKFSKYYIFNELKNLNDLFKIITKL